MKYQITLFPSEEGFAVCVPSLPGCWSQGATSDEAVQNIAIAIREYLDGEDVPPNGTASSSSSGPNNGPPFAEVAEVREVEVTN